MRETVQFWGGVAMGLGIAAEHPTIKLPAFAVSFAAAMWLLRDKNQRGRS